LVFVAATIGKVFVIDLPPAVKQFIVQHVESLAQLEVLLYVRQNARHAVHPHELANTLALTPEMSSGILADLVRRGFAVREDGCFRYQVTSEVDHLIEELANAYRSLRIAVTNEIYSKPSEKVKTFAEAFRLRPDEV
jgi:DNA-binding MarR family transcriptional regulator